MRSIKELVDLWPGSRHALAEAMGRHPNTLRLIERCRFARPPFALLQELHAALASRGLIDGSEVPTMAELVVAWQENKRAREEIGRSAVDAARPSR